MGFTLKKLSPQNGTIKKWDPENRQLWKKSERRIALRNLWVSTVCLLFAFAIWQYWSVISVQMAEKGFKFTTHQFFLLPAIAGLMGATLRIPQSFVIAVAGGRNSLTLTMALLCIPAFFTGLALQNLNTPYSVFVILSALSGIGGGVFASMISNLGWFFPKRLKGTYLGLSAGIGNLGVSVMQFALPLIVLWSVFGLAAGKAPYIQNSSYVFVPIMIICTALSWFYTNTLEVSAPHLHSTLLAFAKTLFLFLVGFFTGMLGLFCILYWHISEWIILPLIVLATVMIMRALPGILRKSVRQQFAIFSNKHTWILTYLYTMTLGSFIGFSAVFPLLIRALFGSVHSGGPNPFLYAWIGPLLASIMRPIGGMLADKWRGSVVTFWVTIFMTLMGACTAYIVYHAHISKTPMDVFTLFLLCFLALFILSGLGNGSIYQMMAHAFTPHESGPVMGWASSISAYGAYLIPSIFGQYIEMGHPSYALWGLTIYYLSCVFLVFYYYVRKGAEVKC